MKKHNFFIFILIALIIAALSVLIYFSKKKAEFIYCDPATPRGNDDLKKWQEAITPKESMSEINQDFFDNIEVISDANYLQVKYPYSHTSENHFKYEIREIDANETLEVGDGTLKLCSIGVAFCDVNHINGDNVPYKFFNEKFQPEKDDIIEKIWKYKKYEDGPMFDYNPWPIIKFCFEHEGIEDVMFNSIKVFDARTFKVLSSGYSSSGTRTDDWNGHEFQVELPVWYKAPICLVMDVSFGPTETFMISPEPGEGFTYDGFDCRLVGVFDNINPYRHSSSSRENIKTHKFPKADSEDTGLRCLFACQPAVQTMPLTFDILDENGDKLSERGGSSSGFLKAISLQHPLEKVAMIQAKYRTNRYRIIINLPYIPGLPEQNENIDNLFEVYIPYVKFDTPNKLDDFLRETLQLSRSSIVGNKKTNNNIKFPIVFTDVTIGDIVKQYKPGTTVNADIENDQLEIQYPLPFMKKMKKLFQRIRQK